MSEAVCANVGENYRAKVVLFEETAEAVLGVGDRATTRCNLLISNGVGGRRLVHNDTGQHLLSSP